MPLHDASPERPSLDHARHASDAPPPNPEAAQALSDVFRARPAERVPPDDVLLWQGDAAGDVVLVEAGTLRLVHVLSDGRRAILRFLGPGDVAGLADRRSHFASVEAVSFARIRRVPRALVFARAATCPAVQERLVLALAEEMNAAQEHAALLARKSADERVASFFLRWARRRGVPGEPAQTFLLPMKRADIADHLGLTVESVCRAVTKLKDEGVLRAGTRHHVEIRRWDVLRWHAAEDDGALDEPRPRRREPGWSPAGYARAC